MNIQSSTSYDQFDTITGNRIINQKKVQNIIEDIENGLNLLPYCPIIVYSEDGNYKIVDGQHRFEVSKKLETPVYFVECEPLSLRNIARMNSRSAKWSNKDFLNCYIKLGIEDYKILKQFLQDYGIIYSAAIELLMQGTVRKSNSIMDIFRNGEFKVNHLEKSKELVKLVQDVFDRYKFRSDRDLIWAMEKIRKKGVCDIELLKSKIAQAPMLMNKQSNWKDYIYNIEQVYNHNNKKRVVIF